MEFTKKEILEGKSTQVITEEKNKGEKLYKNKDISQLVINLSS